LETFGGEGEEIMEKTVSLHKVKWRYLPCKPPMMGKVLPLKTKPNQLCIMSL
jgi:hypothetical protein